jgi:hypothetical protein
MCLFIPNFPFRNTIVVDTNGNDDFARPLLGAPQQLKTKRPIIWAPNFPHQNYIQFRNSQSLTHDEIPAPPIRNGIKLGRIFRFGESSRVILRNRFVKKLDAEPRENEKDENISEGDVHQSSPIGTDIGEPDEKQQMKLLENTGTGKDTKFEHTKLRINEARKNFQKSMDELSHELTLLKNLNVGKL